MTYYCLVTSGSLNDYFEIINLTIDFIPFSLIGKYIERLVNKYKTVLDCATVSNRYDPVINVMLNW